MNDVSEHCLCDHCSGQDCNTFTEEELAQQQKEHDAAIARKAREDAYDKFLDEVRKEEYNNCGYVDMDSIEGVYVRLRTTPPQSGQEQPR